MTAMLPEDDPLPNGEPVPDESPVPEAPTARMISWAKNSSVYRLNQKMMTERALFDALKKKALTKFSGISPALAGMIASAGIAFCMEHKLLDDRTYAEVKTRSGSRSGHSRRRIARDLGNKGVARPLIEETLGDVDDLASAINYARKRAFGPFRKVPLDEKRKAKEFSAFARNGYSASIAIQVMGLSDEELDELERQE